MRIFNDAVSAYRQAHADAAPAEIVITPDVVVFILASGEDVPSLVDGVLVRVGPVTSAKVGTGSRVGLVLTTLPGNRPAIVACEAGS